MPRWLKIVLLLFGLGFLGLAGTCGAIVYFAAESAPELRAQAEQAEEEGRRDATHLDQPACLDRSLARAEPCEELSAWNAGKCSAVVKFYGHACLKSATPVPGFCDGLPRPTALLDVAKWASTTCADKGYAGSQSCGRVVQIVLEHCAGAPSSAGGAGPAIPGSP